MCTMNPHDDQALAHAIEHRKMMRSSLHAESRCRGLKPATCTRKPIPADRLAAILSAVRAAFPGRVRPNVQQIASAAGCTRELAREARRVAIASKRWPYGTG